MIILRIYSIFTMLLLLFAIAYSKDIKDNERAALWLWLMYAPVLIYLLYGGN